MEIVVIEDLVASYRTTWVRIARTSDAEHLAIGDVLRKRGDGQGSEELKVEAISEGRVFVNRGHGPSSVGYHPHGTVFTVLGAVQHPLEVQVTPYTAEMRRQNLAKAREAKKAKQEAGAL